MNHKQRNKHDKEFGRWSEFTNHYNIYETDLKQNLRYLGACSM